MTGHDYASWQAHIAADCASKVRYASKAEAKPEAKRTSAKHGGPPMIVYRCGVCQFWHVGRAQPYYAGDTWEEDWRKRRRGYA